MGWVGRNQGRKRTQGALGGPSSRQKQVRQDTIGSGGVLGPSKPTNERVEVRSVPRIADLIGAIQDVGVVWVPV